MNVYEFAEPRAFPSTPPTVCIGRLDEIEKAISREEMSRIFGGYIVYRSEGTKGDYIGVWSKRKASEFRRVLRERGAALILHRSRPPKVSVKSRATR